MLSRGIMPSSNVELPRPGFFLSMPMKSFHGRSSIGFGTSLDSELAAADAVMVPSYFFLRGKRLKYAPGYPIYHARLSRRGKVRFLSHHDGGFGENIEQGCRVIYGKYPTITISTKVNCWSGCTSISIMPIGKSGSVRTELFSTDANA